jgi:hypothetical protein
MGSTSLFGTWDFGRDLEIPFVNIFSLGLAAAYNLVQTVMFFKIRRIAIDSLEIENLHQSTVSA